MNFLPQLFLSCYPPDLYLLNSQEYRWDPPCPAKALLKSGCIFYFFFFYLLFNSSVYILDNNPLFHIPFANISSHCVAYLFILLTMSSWSRNSNFNEVLLVSPFKWILFLVLQVKNHCQTQGYIYFLHLSARNFLGFSFSIQVDGQFLVNFCECCKICFLHVCSFLAPLVEKCVFFPV